MHMPTSPTEDVDKALVAAIAVALLLAEVGPKPSGDGRQSPAPSRWRQGLREQMRPRPFGRQGWR